MSGNSNLIELKVCIELGSEGECKKVARKMGTENNTVPSKVYSFDIIIYRILFPVQEEVQYQN